MTDTTSTVLGDITENLAIPDDGVLSKVLFSNDQIRVVGFAFDTDQELTEHTAAVPAIIQVISGTFLFTMGDETTTMTASTWMHLDASVPHSVVATEPSRLLVTLLR